MWRKRRVKGESRIGRITFSLIGMGKIIGESH